MIYYACFYLKNGEIHLKPFFEKADAEACIEKTSASEKFRDQIDLAKVVKKDPEKEWFKAVRGYWI